MQYIAISLRIFHFYFNPQRVAIFSNVHVLRYYLISSAYNEHIC